jgi:hypothetical protein
MVQINYSIFDRHAEERLLPLAADRGVGVLVTLPLAKAHLIKIVEGHRLPGFASESAAAHATQTTELFSLPPSNPTGIASNGHLRTCRVVGEAPTEKPLARQAQRRGYR